MLIWALSHNIPQFCITQAYAFQNRVTNFPKKEWTSSTWELGRAGGLVNGTVVWTRLSRAKSLQYAWSVIQKGGLRGTEITIDTLYFLLVVSTPSKGSDLVLPRVSFTLAQRITQRIKAIWGTIWPPWQLKVPFWRKFLFLRANFPSNIQLPNQRNISRGRVQWSRWWVIIIHLEKPKM